MSGQIGRLRFDREHINPAFLTLDLDASFEKFVCELLGPELPDLLRFSAAGKDGAIDLSSTESRFRTVVECKCIGSDTVPAIRSAWADVADRLRRNLEDPAGPARGQAQYSPWYRESPVIRRYLFCVSAEAKNQHGIDASAEIAAEIESFFRSLASERPHLAHLGDIQVQVLLWNHLEMELEGQAYLLLRWFPHLRPLGLIPFAEPASSREFTFPDYLVQTELPFYSPRRHWDARGRKGPLTIHDETELVGALDEEEYSGLIITGRGGVGKTRLTLELGRQARAQGWQVFRVLRSLRTRTFEEFLQRAGFRPGARALFVFDYVETQADFSSIAQTLVDANATFGWRLRFLGNCRRSYYSTLDSNLPHRLVDLSPTEAPASALARSAYQDLVEYQRGVVAHILRHGGVTPTDPARRLCRDVPILAVFLSYLHRSDRREDLQELLEAEEFAEWVSRRIQRVVSRGAGDALWNGRLLAQLTCLFPMASPRFNQPVERGQRLLLDALKEDGWVEERQSEETELAMLHDVFADQIVVHYSVRNVATTAPFVLELFALARQYDAVLSALTSLNRLADQEVYRNLDWVSILDREVREFPDAWLPGRTVLVQSPLLSPETKIQLLLRHPSFWEGAQPELAFQLAVGWLARWALDHQGELSSTDWVSFLRLIKDCARQSRATNYCLTSALVADSKDAEIQEASLAWIDQHPTEQQTHYLLVAWLTAGLDRDRVQQAVEVWAGSFQATWHLSFLTRAWLSANGPLDVIRESVLSWLERFQARPTAQFVYCSWLDAGGGLDAPVGESTLGACICKWIALHGDKEAAQFVYCSWLDAGGGLDAPVGESTLGACICKWIALRRDKEAAGFVYRSWLDAGGGLDAPVGESTLGACICEWIALHGDKEAAGFVYRSWLDAGGGLDAPVDESTLGACICEWIALHGDKEAAGFVYRSWLDAGGGLDAPVDESTLGVCICKWIALHGDKEAAGFVYRSWLDAGGGLDAPVDEFTLRACICEWIALHGDKEAAGFVYRSWLDAGGGLDAPVDESTLGVCICKWIALHGDKEAAGFVYRSWLKEGGDFESIAEDVCQWMHVHRRGPEAVFLSKELTKRPQLPVETVRDILEWCRACPSDEDAAFRISRLGRKLGHDELVGEVLKTARVVLNATLGLPPGGVRARWLGIDFLFSWLASLPQYAVAGPSASVDALWLEWIRHQESFAPRPPGPRNYVWWNRLVERTFDLIRRGDLDLCRDAPALEHFFAYLNGPGRSFPPMVEAVGRGLDTLVLAEHAVLYGILQEICAASPPPLGQDAAAG